MKILKVSLENEGDEIVSGESVKGKEYPIKFIFQIIWKLSQDLYSLKTIRKKQLMVIYLFWRQFTSSIIFFFFF
jgi:hypothetical protein